MLVQPTLSVPWHPTTAWDCPVGGLAKTKRRRGPVPYWAKPKKEALFAATTAGLSLHLRAL